MSAKASDLERLSAAELLIWGEAGNRARRNALYAGYVAALLAVSYGVPATQAVLYAVNPVWLDAWLATPGGVAALSVAAGTTLLSAYLAGTIRGPVVPMLPFVDNIVATDLHRAVTLRRGWRISRAGCLFAGTLVGAVLGSGPVLVGAAGLPDLVLDTAVGAGAGALVAAAWLVGMVRGAGCVRGHPLGGRPQQWWRARSWLRSLRIEVLRRQAARSTLLGGAVLAGDLRGARLVVATPTTRARHRRLRPGRPVPTVIRRDLLGLRRAPLTGLAGLLLALAGSGLLQWSGSDPHVPLLVAAAGWVLGYLAAGLLSEGLRLLADTMGTPPLLGISPRTQAVTHLAVPLAAVAGAGCLVAAAVALGGTAAAVAPLWLAPGLLVLGGGHLAAAFRGQPPLPAFAPQSGPSTLAVWYLGPMLSVVVAGTASTALLARNPTDPLTLITTVAAAAVVAWWGVHRVDAQSMAHRT